MNEVEALAESKVAVVCILRLRRWRWWLRTGGDDEIRRPIETWESKTFVSEHATYAESSYGTAAERDAFEPRTAAYPNAFAHGRQPTTIA